jgi:hypothetical protein
VGVVLVVLVVLVLLVVLVVLVVLLVLVVVVLLVLLESSVGGRGRPVAGRREIGLVPISCGRLGKYDYERVAFDAGEVRIGFKRCM